MPSPRLKPVSRQVIVLTGATSGIGLATARMAARRGAKLVLTARNAEALSELAEELRAAGAQAEWIAADVADKPAMERVAAFAVERFGGFDTWVNDAGAFTLGHVEDTPYDDHRRVFDVIYWGVVHGTQAALDHLKGRPGGGAIVNIGSILSDRTIALQGPYCAAKHAVKGITDAVRMEARMRGYPVSVSLIKPAAIDTPYAEHLRNLTDAPGARLPPPVYHPRLVAIAILHAAEHQVRDLTVGGAGAMISFVGNLLPSFTDAAMVAAAKRLQTTSVPPRPERADNLHQPRADLAERSSKGVKVRETSLLLQAQMNPISTMVATAVGLIGLAALMRSRPMPAWQRAARRLARM
ncbi:MAG: SDR family NAD(P)-dependent oxidoreductase [Acetobacteraceae bacterium]|nr:SDR family NAD(P)-dependent oxidoreductase [Acetobacteraceae bacterium]